MLTPDQVLQIAGSDTGFISYDKLKHVKSINELFKRFKKVLLLYINYMDNNNIIGHYNALVKKPKSIEFFDPFGMKPDKILMMKTKSDRTATEQEHNYLSKLLLASETPVEYSSCKLQAEGSETCGYWCGIFLRYSNLSMTQWESFFNSLKKKYTRKQLDEMIIKLSQSI